MQPNKQHEARWLRWDRPGQTISGVWQGGETGDLGPIGSLRAPDGTLYKFSLPQDLNQQLSRVIAPTPVTIEFVEETELGEGKKAKTFRVILVSTVKPAGPEKPVLVLAKAQISEDMKPRWTKWGRPGQSLTGEWLGTITGTYGDLGLVEDADGVPSSFPLPVVLIKELEKQKVQKGDWIAITYTENRQSSSGSQYKMFKVTRGEAPEVDPGLEDLATDSDIPF